MLVTGSTGLVGNALVSALLDAGCKVRATARHAPSAPWAKHPGCEFIPHDLESSSAHLTADMDAVVHLAARVHVMRDRADDPLAENRRLMRELGCGNRRVVVR